MNTRPYEISVVRDQHCCKMCRNCLKVNFLRANELLEKRVLIHRVVCTPAEATFEQDRFPAKKEQLKLLQGLLPEIQGQNLALTVLYVPYSLESEYVT
jgi:hypothetical protein